MDSASYLSEVSKEIAEVYISGLTRFAIGFSIFKKKKKKKKTSHMPEPGLRRLNYHKTLDCIPVRRAK